MQRSAKILGVDTLIGAERSGIPLLNLSTTAAVGSALASLNQRVAKAIEETKAPVENKKAEATAKEVETFQSKYKPIEEDPKKGLVDTLEELFQKLRYAPPKDKNGAVIFVDFLERREGLFSYQEILEHFDELFPPADYQKKRTLIETYVCEFVVFLRAEIKRLSQKYVEFYNQVIAFFEVSFKNLRNKTDIKDYKLFCGDESRKLRTILSSLDAEGRGVGLLQDLERLEKRIITCQTAKKNESEEIFRYILPNPLGGEPFVIDKSSKLAKSDHEKMTAFYTNYEELLLINIHYVESFKNKVLEIFRILNGFPGPYVEGVGEQRKESSAHAYRLPEELRLLVHPPSTEKKAERKKEEPKKT